MFSSIPRDLLHYARILVKISIDDELPDTITFEIEWGGIQHNKVEFEWKPDKCVKCKMFGNLEEICKKGIAKRVWQEKNKVPQQGQIPTRRPGKEQVDQNIPTGNTFDMLQNV